jgi:3-hydroxymyristoyl/3-hydroxydecanoyl-(acyl carrier protein) dehydratase
VPRSVYSVASERRPIGDRFFATPTLARVDLVYAVRFVLIDTLLELEPGKRARARKTFSPADDFLADHFPGLAIVPGVLITEAMGQTAGWLLASTLGFSRWPLLSMIQSAKFRRLVTPGEELLIDVSVRAARQDDFEIDAEAHVGGARTASARLYFHAFDVALAEGDADRFKAWAQSTFQALGGFDLLGDNGDIMRPPPTL